MLTFPGSLTSEQFLAQYWQKKPLFMAAGLKRARPSISRNELAWLATLDDVESRIVFVERENGLVRYRAETGPFDVRYLEALPGRDWTLLVHDVEKHLPAMRGFFKQVPFVPDWRIDDLMVSFAAPGGGVGPHRDNYDVFLCQGIGVRHWRFTIAQVSANSAASDDLALLDEFDGDESHLSYGGDVLYLPPGVAHWGTAQRACMTYSIGMRAPQISDLIPIGEKFQAKADAFYTDEDLTLHEIRPGYISRQSVQRAAKLLNRPAGLDVQESLGRSVTTTKTWLTPDSAPGPCIDQLIDDLLKGGKICVHGMARIAFDDNALYVNGARRPLADDLVATAARICKQRKIGKTGLQKMSQSKDSVLLLKWMAQQGAFDLPDAFNH